MLGCPSGEQTIEADPHFVYSLPCIAFIDPVTIDIPYT